MSYKSACLLFSLVPHIAGRYDDCTKTYNELVKSEQKIK